jgi:hypothetical protein
MTLKKAIQIVEQHHSWRQGFHSNRVDSAELTSAMALILQTLKELNYANV